MHENKSHCFRVVLGRSVQFVQSKVNRSRGKVLPTEEIMRYVYGEDDKERERKKKEREKKERREQNKAPDNVRVMTAEPVSLKADGTKRNYLKKRLENSEDKKKNNKKKKTKKKTTNTVLGKKRKRSSSASACAKRRKLDDAGSTVMYVIEALPKPGRMTNRTYVGVTNNFDRRIAEHNSEKRGKQRKGALSTCGRKWKPICIVSGFRTRTEALQLEYRMHHPKPSQKGPDPQTRRVKNLCASLSRERFTCNAPPTKEMKLHVHWRSKSHRERIGPSQAWPSNVRHHTLPNPLTHDAIVAQSGE